MDKIIRILIIVFILGSCSKKEEFNIDKYKIVFLYGNWTTIDLLTGNLKIDHLGLQYKDKINFSNEEKLKIIKSFNKYGMGKKMNEVWCLDENSFMPPCNDEIWIYYNNKIQSKLVINFNYTINTFQWHNQEYRIVSFRNDINKLLENNRDFKRALDTLQKFQKQKKAIFL